MEHRFTEIFGTVTSPHLPTLADGAARLSVTLKTETQPYGEFIASWSCQANGSPMPFQLQVDSTCLETEQALVLEARCSTAPGQAGTVAFASQPFAGEASTQVGPLDLLLEPIDGIAQATAEKMPIPPAIIPLSGVIQIPPELMLEEAYLDTTLLLIQEDGYSNRASSNIAEHSRLIRQPNAPFTLLLDASVIPAGYRVKLHMGLFSLDRQQLLAGNVIKNLDLSNPMDLSEITLRKPRR